MATIAEQLIEKGEKKGLEKGIEKGIEKGQRGALLRQLRHRFGALSAEVCARIEQASRAELERWLDQVLTASTVAEALAGPPPPEPSR